MPCRYRIDAEQRLVVTTAWDRLSFAEAKSHQDQLKNDPAFNAAFDQLIDASAVTDLDLSNDEASELAGTVFFSSGARRALVAASPVVFGVFRLMEARHHLASGSENTGVFYDRTSALHWLDRLSLVEAL